MFKLIDIIKGGGSNPKLNKFLNRYVISKKEKTNLIKEIKNSKGGNSSSDMEYYKVDGMPTSSVIALYKIKNSNGIKIQGVAEERSEYTKAIAYAPISHNGVIYNNLKDVFIAMSEGVTEEEIEEMFSMFTPITKEEFYDLNNV